MRALSPSPPANSGASQPLHQTLQAVSDLCTGAVLSGDVPYAALLAASVRKHLLTPCRRRLYRTPTPAYLQHPLDSPYADRDTARHVHSLLLALLRPPVPLSRAYDVLRAALQPLPRASAPFAVLSAVWRDLLSALRSHLFAWLVHAVVDDPHLQFFITAGAKPAVVPDRLPAFVSPQVAERVLFAGNARKCAILLGDGGCAGQGTSEERRVFAELLADPIRAALEIEAVSLRWRVTAVRQLSETLPFIQIRDRVFLLRQYLLLGHSAFWRSFFDELRTKPLLLTGRVTEPEELQAVEKTLNQILAATTNEFSASDLDDVNNSPTSEPPLSLKVTESGDIVPHFTLTFAESQILASRSTVYCDVFSIAFEVRRVACELRASFSQLQLLDRQLRRETWARRKPIATASLVPIRELRRCMANFVDGFEWYIQAEVLQPKFDKLLRLLDDCNEGREGNSPTSSDAPFFDTLCSLHEELMDKILTQCFVGQEQINARLTAIFASCLGLCDFIQELSVEALRQCNFSDTMKALQTAFSRNVGLLVRLLLHMQHGSVESPIPSLLVRINFNRCFQS